MDKISFTEEQNLLANHSAYVKLPSSFSFLPAEPSVQKEKEIPFLILIAGGAASGKTTLTKQIKELLEQNQKGTVVLSTDSYYSYSPLLFQQRDPNLQDIHQSEEFIGDLDSLLSGKSIYLPTYDDSAERKFKRSTVLINSASVIIVEGMFALFYEEVRKKSGLRVYLEISDDQRLKRRLKRYQDGLNEGKFHKPIEYEIKRFHTYVKKNHETYVIPARKYANLIVDNSNDDESTGNAEKVVKKVLADINDINDMLFRTN